MVWVVERDFKFKREASKINQQGTPPAMRKNTQVGGEARVQAEAGTRDRAPVAARSARGGTRSWRPGSAGGAAPRPPPRGRARATRNFAQGSMSHDFKYTKAEPPRARRSNRLSGRVRDLPAPEKTKKTMKKIIHHSTQLAAALALGLAVSASAQSLSNAPAAPPPDAAAGGGLLGDDYSQVQFGYDHEKVDVPDLLHEYGFVYNQPLAKTALAGTDFNLNYDYLTGSAAGIHDDLNEGLAGLTEYLAQSWGKPFVSGDAGYAWQRAGGVSRKSFAYSATGGVEFPVLSNLALTPFATYQAEPDLYNHEVPLAYFPDHRWDYGLKATYRLDAAVERLGLGRSGPV